MRAISCFETKVHNYPRWVARPSARAPGVPPRHRARREALASIGSEEAGDHRVSGTAATPAADWPNTPVVRLLLDAERDCQEGGWTSLSRAREYIRERRPDLTPMRYGCKSWRHLLQETRLFVIEKRATDDPEVKRVWYRSTRRASAR